MRIAPKQLGANPLNLPTEAVAGGGAANIASRISWPVQDAIHLLHSADSVHTGAVAHHAFTSAASLGSTVISNLGGFLGIAAGTGISAWINNMVHGHHEKTITDRYRPELANITGKEEKAVNVADLYNVAQSNPSLDEELDRNRGMRNLRTAATLVASTAAFAAVFAAISLFPPLAGLGAAAAAGGILSGAGLGFIGATMGISIGVLKLTGSAAGRLGEKLFGYDKPNVEDHVEGLTKLHQSGKQLTPEKVMGVFVAASPEMQQQIENKFGNRYDRLSAEQQVQAERMFGDNIPLEALTDAINRGEMSPRELTFTVNGQMSGLSSAPAEAYAPARQAAAQQVAEKALAAAPEKEPITATQWRDMVEKQRAEQGVSSPAR